MTLFLVERYWPGVTPEAARDLTDRALCETRRRPAGPQVVGSALLHEDETVFLFYEGASAHDVDEAASSADLRADRVSECLRLVNLSDPHALPERPADPKEDQAK
jgi:hypothetical protein